MDEYDAEVIEQVAKRYEDRIKAFLERCRVPLTEAGWQPGEVIEMFGDDWRWEFELLRSSEEPVGFDLTIAEAKSYGDDPPNGINFSLSIVEYGGRILGGMTPFNYTDAVWVDARDAEAVEERWQYFEDADLSELAGLVEGR